MLRYFALSLILVLFASCEVGPQEIEYGTDACHYCDMTIVAPQHAAQMVTSKGRSYKYDAIECMVHSLQEDFEDTEMSYKLVADFGNPGEFVNAVDAGFLVSEEIQSPMGENLSAFKNMDRAKKAQGDFTGKIFTWEEIQKHLILR